MEEMKPGDFEIIEEGTMYKVPSFAVVPDKGLEHRKLGDMVIHFVRGSKDKEESIPAHHGTVHESLMEMMLHDLKYKNKLVPSRETSLSITALEEALLWQKRRAEVRKKEGVQGTYKKSRFSKDPDKNIEPPSYDTVSND